MNTIRRNTCIFAVVMVVAFGYMTVSAFAATRTAEEGDTVSGYVGGDRMAWYVFQVLNNQEDGAAQISDVNLIITGKEYFAPSSELMDRIIDKIKDAGFYDKDDPGFHEAVMSALNESEIANDLQQERNNDSGGENTDETNTDNENASEETFEDERTIGNEINLLDGEIPEAAETSGNKDDDEGLLVGDVNVGTILKDNMSNVADPKSMPVEEGEVYAANSPEVSEDPSLWELIASIFQW